MKHITCVLFAVAVLAGLSGCQTCSPGLFNHGCCDPCGEPCCEPTGCCDETCCGESCETGCEPCGKKCLLDGLCLPCLPCFCRPCCDQAAGPPATGAVTYPYYTCRGPRDFFQSCPRPIGP